MPRSARFDPVQAVARCPIAPWSGSVWRAHSRRHGPTDDGDSRHASGLWHVGADDPDRGDGPAWPALYTALDLAVCSFEVQRIVTRRGGTIAGLKGYRYSELRVRLEAVLDVRDESAMGLPSGALTRDDDLSLPRSIAYAAHRRAVEAMLIPSASLVGDDLILFLDLRRAGSVVDVIRTLDPNLGGA